MMRKEEEAKARKGNLPHRAEKLLAEVRVVHQCKSMGVQTYYKGDQRCRELCRETEKPITGVIVQHS
jgi:hypothetical protein